MYFGVVLIKERFSSMLITKKALEKIGTVDSGMTKQGFVFNYNGKHRSDLKIAQKATASVDVMDKSNKLFKKYEK